MEAHRQSARDAETALESARDLKVAKYSEVPYRRLQVELENGQVWRQIAGATVEALESVCF